MEIWSRSVEWIDSLVVVKATGIVKISATEAGVLRRACFQQRRRLAYQQFPLQHKRVLKLEAVNMLRLLEARRKRQADKVVTAIVGCEGTVGKMAIENLHFKTLDT